MTTRFFESDFCVRVALTLTHSLWQAGAIAVLAIIIGAALKGSAARLRYGVFVCALGLMVLSTITTFVWFSRSITTEMIAEQAAIQSPPAVESPEAKAQPDSTSRYLAPEVRPFAGFEFCRYAPHCVSVYIMGVIVMMAHLLFALRGGVRLRQKSLPLHDTQIDSLLASAVQSIGLRAQLAIAYCGRVCVPTVVGIVRPLILLPLSLMNGLSTEQIELLLMHELAHLRRHDHWVNLAQRFVESLLFFNPAVWMISRRIRIERELACDELVLSAGAKSVAYADSLLRIAELNHQAAERITSMALAATEGSADLKRRILRILGIQSNESMRINRAWPVAIGLGIVLLALVFSITGAQAREGDDQNVNASKAEMMGRVEDFFLHNYRDVTARKSLEWGDVDTDAQGNRSIRYMYEATILDKKKIVSNEVFAFDKDGKFVSVNKVEGYPQEKKAPVKDVNSQKGMQDLVEDFFSKNYRDITARKTLEWGEPVKNPDGTHTIRYKYEATIWDKDIMLINEAFTFDAKGEYVKAEQVEPKREIGTKVVDLKGKKMGSKEAMQQLVEDFFKQNYHDLTSRKTLEWGDPVREANGNYSIRYKAEVVSRSTDKMALNQVFTFDPKGNWVNVELVLRPVDPKLISVRTLDKRVEDFPEKEDMSTPESAYAAVNRLSASGDESEWGRLSCAEIRKRLPANAPKRTVKPEVAQEWLTARIIEVRTYRDTDAVVFAEIASSFWMKGIDCRHFKMENGQWLNSGQDIFGSMDQAREKFNKIASFQEAQRTE